MSLLVDGCSFSFVLMALLLGKYCRLFVVDELIPFKLILWYEYLWNATSFLLNRDVNVSIYGDADYGSPFV